MDQRADGRPDRGLRAGDDAVQRQRLLQRRRQLAERLVRDRVQPELQRGGHHHRRRDRAVDLAAVRGHRQPQLPADRTTRSWSRRPSSCSPTRSVGSDGFLHAVANAHETQWAVQDPTTDLAADQALFPAVVNAATLLNTDSSLVAQLKTAEGEIEPYARTDASQPRPAAELAADVGRRGRERRRGGTDVIADSYQPSATLHNSENIGLEPVWPYGVIGDGTTVNGDNLTALADRTYNSRPNVNNAGLELRRRRRGPAGHGQPGRSRTWSRTPRSYQAYISGLANLPAAPPATSRTSSSRPPSPPRWTRRWRPTTTAPCASPRPGRRAGTPPAPSTSRAAPRSTSRSRAAPWPPPRSRPAPPGTMTVRNPWSGQQAEVVNGSTGAVVVAATTAARSASRSRPAPPT